jgi:hypothetical protein
VQALPPDQAAPCGKPFTAKRRRWPMLKASKVGLLGRTAKRAAPEYAGAVCDLRPRLQSS